MACAFASPSALNRTHISVLLDLSAASLDSGVRGQPSGDGTASNTEGTKSFSAEKTRKTAVPTYSPESTSEISQSSGNGLPRSCLREDTLGQIRESLDSLGKTRFFSSGSALSSETSGGTKVFDPLGVSLLKITEATGHLSLRRPVSGGVNSILKRF